MNTKSPPLLTILLFHLGSSLASAQIRFTFPPRSQMVRLGSEVSFEAIALGATNYQWQFNGRDIPGATNRFFRLSEVQHEHLGAYVALTFGDSGSIASDPAILSLIPPHIGENVPLGPDPTLLPSTLLNIAS